MFRILAVALLMPLLTFAAPIDAESDELQLDAYKGRVVVVDFWASWCVPCRRSFPWMNAMVAKYADQGLVVIAVNLDKDRADADAFLAETPADFEIRYNPDASLAREFGVEAMPSSFVFNRNGELVARHLGFKVKKQDEYEALLVNALRNAQ